MARCWRVIWSVGYIQQLKALLVSELSVSFQIKIGRPKFYAGEIIYLFNAGLGVRNNSDKGLASLSGAHQNTVIAISYVTNKQFIELSLNIHFLEVFAATDRSCVYVVFWT